MYLCSASEPFWQFYTRMYPNMRLLMVQSEWFNIFQFSTSSQDFLNLHNYDISNPTCRMPGIWMWIASLRWSWKRPLSPQTAWGAGSLAKSSWQGAFDPLVASKKLVLEKGRKEQNTKRNWTKMTKTYGPRWMLHVNPFVLDDFFTSDC